MCEQGAEAAALVTFSDAHIVAWQAAEDFPITANRLYPVGCAASLMELRFSSAQGFTCYPPGGFSLSEIKVFIAAHNIGSIGII